MKLNCCILEDEPAAARKLAELLEKWGKERHCEILIDMVLSARQLFQKNINAYKIIFMDIVLDGKEKSGNVSEVNKGEKTDRKTDSSNICMEMNGIEAARKLRADGYKGDLVFLTNFQEYVFEGYPVNAIDYLMKPASYEKIYRCMDCVLDKNVEKIFVYRLKDRIFQIPYQEILYLQSSNHSTEIITAEKTYSIPLAFRKIYTLLPAQFSKCHRTLIVNMYHIEHMTNKEIQLVNKEKLPVSQTYLGSLRADFMRIVCSGRK